MIAGDWVTLAAGAYSWARAISLTCCGGEGYDEIGAAFAPGCSDIFRARREF
jgi:hypothetical protein